MRAGLLLATTLSLVSSLGCLREPVAPPRGTYMQPPPYGYAPAPWSGPPMAPMSPMSTPGQVALAFAEARIGAPYCWGGTGPGCYDCSGLTQAAWRAAGRAIPRSSSEQIAGLPGVPIAAVQLGDILWRPGHVGLYAGGGWVLAATKTGDVVRYQPLAYYQRAVRPF